MYQIRDWLYVGKYSDTKNKDYLAEHNITAMLELASPVTQPGIPAKYIAMEDGEPFVPDKLSEALAFIREQKADGRRILVACGAGISRSTVVAMAALMEHEERTLFDAYREVYHMHRGANPHHELLIALAKYHGQDLDLLDIWDEVRAIQRGD